MPIQWRGPGAMVPRSKQKVLVLSPGESAIATLLDQEVVIDTHWVAAAKRRLPCQGADCDHCAHGLPADMRAYLPASVRRFVKRGMMGGVPLGDWEPAGSPMVVELTESHAEFLAGGNLTGLVIELHKPVGDSKRSIRIVNTGTVDERPPPPFDVRPILARLWGLREPGPGEVLKLRRQA